MISFNWEHGGIVPPSLTPHHHHPPHRSSLLTAQRANLRRTLAPALTHCQTKTEVILFSLTRVSEAWGKSHHPWRTAEGVREIAAYFLPEHAAGITDHAPLYPSIPSAVLPYVQYQRDQIHVKMLKFSPFADKNRLQWVPVGGISVRSSSPGAEQPFLQGRRLPYLIPADGMRWWPCQPVPLIFFFSFLSISPCFHTALLITGRIHCVPLLQEPLENVLFVMWSPRWWRRGDTLLQSPTSSSVILVGQLWSFSSPQALTTLLSCFLVCFVVVFIERGQGIIHIYVSLMMKDDS